MPDDREARIDALIEQAMRTPPDDRDAFLRRECANDTTLLRALRDLVANQTSVPADFLGGAIDSDPPARSWIADIETIETPETIGAYRILREIGRGGMGVVYEAEQRNPRRRVALKVVRQGLQSPSLIRRFQQEAHVLGQLQHPGIAHVHEAGSAPIGDSHLPFFAMELLDGASIVESSADLSTRERLELIARVCDAVQHAHQKGVIHRDLKPANIIVVRHESGTAPGAGGGSNASAMIDTIGRPKILDFGIARLLDADMQAPTLQTHAGQIVGTLGYMSPEQVAGDTDRIDTRCDVYAIGVILFELLTRRRPYDLSGKPLAEAARIVRETSPPRAGAIDRSLRGDIETIIARSMEKDPDRRYASAGELAADIRRHLRDEPIEARPASSLYQVSRFARRNKGLVAGLAVAFVALAAGLIGTLSSLREARSQRDAAETARIEAERVAEFQAKLLSGQSARAFGVELLADVRSEYRKALEQANLSDDTVESQYAIVDEALRRITGVNIGRLVLSRSQAGRAIELLESDYTDDPVIEARLRHGVGLIYMNLGMYADAAGQFERVVDLRRKHLGETHRDTLTARTRLATAYRDMGKTEIAEALLRANLESMTKTLGPEHEDTLWTMAQLSRLLSNKLEFEEAEALLTKTLDALGHTRGAEDSQTLNRRNELGLLHLYEGKLGEAVDEFRELLAIRERVDGPDAPAVVSVRNNLMSALFKQNRLREAEPIARATLESSRRTNGREHPTSVMATNNLGMVLFRLKEFEKAAALFREACDSAERLAPENEIRMKATSNLADALRALNRPAEAAPLCRELLAVRRGMGGGRPDLVAQTLEQLGWLMFDLRQFDDALEAWRECVELREGIAPAHWLTNRARSELGMALAALLRNDSAEAYLKGSYEALLAQKDEIPPGDGATCLQDALDRLVAFYEQTNRHDEAVRRRRQAIATSDADAAP